MKASESTTGSASAGDVRGSYRRPLPSLAVSVGFALVCSGLLRIAWALWEHQYWVAVGALPVLLFGATLAFRPVLTVVDDTALHVRRRGRLKPIRWVDVVEVLEPTRWDDSVTVRLTDRSLVTLHGVPASRAAEVRALAASH